ncbi:MAG: hypothetical protein K2I18_04845 [Paramuribaculum sp.]|nr:hypothetical protein [Paramuribaculum sp.]
MIDIIPHIQYLVSRQDCVVLPGWGAFIASYMPARVSGGVLMPPARVVGFNPDVNHNDGVLATSVARRDSIGYDTASSAVSAAVARLRELYDVAGQLTVPRIGTFRRTAEGAMNFVPADFEDSIAGMIYRGLPSVEVGAEELVSDNDAVEAGRNVAALSGLRAFGRVAAAVALLLGLGITLSTPIAVDSNRMNYASVPAPRVSAAKPAVIPPVVSSEAKLFAVIPDSAASTAIVAPQAQSAAHQPKAVSAAADARFYLIVSSHASAAEAQRYIAQNSDENLATLVRDGRYRVYAATGSTFEAAKALTHNADFARRHPDAWVYSK